MRNLLKVGFILLLTNWFEITVVILLIIMCVQFSDLKVVVEKLDWIRISNNNISSDTAEIKSDVSSLRTNSTNTQYNLQYPTIIR